MSTETLNKEINAAQEKGEPQQFLTFTIDKEEYGVDIMRIREVKGWSATTRLPNTPEFMRGVLNLRGIVIPIFDLRARFGGPLTQATEKNVIVIMAVGERIAGLLVDAVSDILTVQPNEIKSSPNDEINIHERFVNGLIAVEERMVVLLDMEKLLSADVEEAITKNGG